MKTNESEHGDADQQPSRLPAISLCRSPHPEKASEREGQQGRVRRPMSRHGSSHNTTDTNPGSVPLVSDCHKSDEASQQDGGRRPNREVKKPELHSTDQTARGEQIANFIHRRHL